MSATSHFARRLAQGEDEDEDEALSDSLVISSGSIFLCLSVLFLSFFYNISPDWAGLGWAGYDRLILLSCLRSASQRR